MATQSIDHALHRDLATTPVNHKETKIIISYNVNETKQGTIAVGTHSPVECKSYADFEAVLSHIKTQSRYGRWKYAAVKDINDHRGLLACELTFTNTNVYEHALSFDVEQHILEVLNTSFEIKKSLCVTFAMSEHGSFIFINDKTLACPKYHDFYKVLTYLRDTVHFFGDWMLISFERKNLAIASDEDVQLLDDEISYEPQFDACDCVGCLYHSCDLVGTELQLRKIPCTKIIQTVTYKLKFSNRKKDVTIYNNKKNPLIHIKKKIIPAMEFDYMLKKIENPKDKFVYS
jgi:hypothetical protein